MADTKCMTNTGTAANIPAFTVKKIEATEFQHARTDKKVASRYAVLIDGVVIGYVASHSEESWATSGRIRTRMIGFKRSWLGALNTSSQVTYLSIRRSDAWSSTRTGCIERLVEAHLAQR